MTLSDRFCKFWDLLPITRTNEARQFKIGTQIDHNKCKLGMTLKPKCLRHFYGRPME